MTPDPERIESWKAIADYVRCDVKTAMRWERERGLPVRRHPGSKRSGVYAFRPEIDAWVQSGRGSPRSIDTPEAAPAATSLAPEPAGSPAPTPLAQPRRPLEGRRAQAAGAVLVIGGLGLLGLAAPVRAPARTPARVEIEGETLTVRDSQGAPVWRHEFPGLLAASGTPGQDLAARSWVGDLDGDGAREVLLLATQPAGDGTYEDVLHCFTAGGTVAWSYRLEDTFRFRSGEFGPPWYAGLVTVYDVGREKRIALSLSHQTWWPAPLLTLDRDGRRLSTFVSSGLVYQLRTTVRDGRPLILAGGVSNSRKAASLIVLDGSAPDGTTPEEVGSPYQCLDCPRGQPVRYYTFPMTELATAAGRAYNSTNSLRVEPAGVLVGVLEAVEAGREAAMVHWRLDDSWRPISARWSDAFPAMHRFFESKGLLRHGADACPERGFRVVQHDPGRGLVESVLPRPRP